MLDSTPSPAKQLIELFRADINFHTEFYLGFSAKVSAHRPGFSGVCGDSARYNKVTAERK